MARTLVALAPLTLVACAQPFATLYGVVESPLDIAPEDGAAVYVVWRGALLEDALRAELAPALPAEFRLELHDGPPASAFGDVDGVARIAVADVLVLTEAQLEAHVVDERVAGAFGKARERLVVVPDGADTVALAAALELDKIETGFNLVVPNPAAFECGAAASVEIDACYSACGDDDACDDGCVDAFFAAMDACPRSTQWAPTGAPITIEMQPAR